MKRVLTREELNTFEKEDLVEAVLRGQEEIDILTGELNKTKALLFGRKSEKKKEEAPEEQIRFEFNEIEKNAPKEDETIEIAVKEHKRKVKKPGKRELDLSKLPKEIIRHSITEEELKKMFPDGWRNLPDEIYSNVEYLPARYIVMEHHVEVYCGKKEDRIVRAEHPKELLKSSIATPSLVAGIMNGKYVNALPLYRMEQEFKRNDVPISRQIMSSWVMKSAERYLSLMYDKMKEKLLSHSVVHADETPVIVTKDGRPAGSKSYMWVYRSNVLDENPVVIYEYQKTRKADHPKEFLSGFSGTLVTDGYEVYHKLARDWIDDLRISGCWVHLKRKFHDAIKSMGKSGENTAAGTLAGQAVGKIQEIFHLDNSFENLNAEQRFKKRKDELEPLVLEFFEWVKMHRDDVTKNSITGRAFSYAISQEEYLLTFLTDGNIPMDNNAAERAIRPFCIGKKNWVMCDTINGAKDSAIIYSITETAKANNLKPYEYLKHLLTEIPKHMDDSNLRFLESLLPWSEELPLECKSE